MGLDIIKKVKRKETDYFRFNWTGARSFQEWNSKNKFPNPFYGWGGGNDGDKIDFSKPTHVKAVKDWIKAFEDKFPKDSKMGIGETMREIMFRVQDSNKSEPYHKKEYLEWDRNTALAWYWFLKDGIERKAKIYFY